MAVISNKFLNPKLWYIITEVPPTSHLDIFRRSKNVGNTSEIVRICRILSIIVGKCRKMSENVGKCRGGTWGGPKKLESEKKMPGLKKIKNS